MFDGVVYIYDVDSFYIPSRVGDPKKLGLKTMCVCSLKHREVFGIDIIDFSQHPYAPGMEYLPIRCG